MLKAHRGDPVSRMNGEPTFEKGRCTYCTSITIETALQLLSTSGTEFRVIPWTLPHLWPAVLYIGNAQFHVEHLRDATDEELMRFNTLVTPLTGIGYFREKWSPDEIYFSAPEWGHAPHGLVP
jgi:hypothetical protein